MPRRFEGQVALVTGGASGIGEAAVLGFAREGAAIVIGDIDRERGRALAERICDEGSRAHFVQVDVSDQGSVDNMVGEAVGVFGALDCAFNNAGVLDDADSLATSSVHNWDRLMSINLRGVWHCLLTTAAASDLAQAGRVAGPRDRG